MTDEDWYPHMRKRELLKVIKRLEASQDYWTKYAKSLEASQDRYYTQESRELRALRQAREEFRETLRERDEVLRFFYPSIPASPIVGELIDWKKLSNDREAILRTRQIEADKRIVNEWNM